MEISFDEKVCSVAEGAAAGVAGRLFSPELLP